VPHRDIGYVAAPDLVWPRDWQRSQQVGVDRVLRVIFTGVGTFLDSLQPHDAHQATHAVTAPVALASW
jgi:hypothetical protein